MFLPYNLEAKTEGGHTTIGLVVFLTAIHLALSPLSEEAQFRVLYQFGCVPDALSLWSPLTSVFLHGDFFHLFGNCLFLWVFGRAVEARLGALRFLGIFLGYGVVAALAQVALSPETTGDVPVIGASGAISAILGTFWILYPGVRVRVAFLLCIIPVYTLRIRAVFILGLWFLGQFVEALLSQWAGSVGVAFWAHVGGFIAGVGGAIWMRWGREIGAVATGGGAEGRVEAAWDRARAGSTGAAGAAAGEIAAELPALGDHPGARLAHARALLLADRAAEAAGVFDARTPNGWWGAMRAGATIPPDASFEAGHALRRIGRTAEARAAYAASAQASWEGRDRALWSWAESVLHTDRAEAARILRRLLDEFPESRLREEARFQLKWLEGA